MSRNKDMNRVEATGFNNQKSAAVLGKENKRSQISMTYSDYGENVKNVNLGVPAWLSG